jgi:23S rRNA pseudouridine1911/1915/1917 synthase
MNKIKIKEETTLLAALVKSGYSRTKIKQLLKYRAVSVGELPATRLDQVLTAGDVLTITGEGEGPTRFTPCPGLEIIYEDEDILVIDKPPRLLTIASETEKTKTAYYMLTACIGERTADGKGRVFIVHRLDQGTSGLLVFAKNEEAKHTLQGSWQDARKKYRAVVEGVPQKSSDTISSYLCESKIHRVYSVKEDNGEGKFAQTMYQVVQAQDDYALLDVTLLTGRKNQIRVHLAELGHPVAGDKKYGAKTDPIKRLALQSYFLAFNHPTSGEPMEFTLDMPGKFKALLRKKDPAKS